jgi:hypothetical protein
MRYRAYLFHTESQIRYLLTATCENPVANPQEWQIVMASATRAAPTDPKGTLVKGGSFSSPLPHSRFVDQGKRLIDANGAWVVQELIKGNIGVDAELRTFILEKGFPQALKRIKERQEPELINLCGGYAEALELMEIWRKRVEEVGLVGI